MRERLVRASTAPPRGEAAVRAQSFAQPAVASYAAALVTSAAIAASGSLSSPLVAAGLLPPILAGLSTSAVAGAIAGVLVVAVSVPDLAREAGSGLAALNHALTWSALYPLAGIAAGLAVRVWRRNQEPTAEQERQRIARDLHDGVAQTLAHLRMELDMLSHPSFAGAHDGSELQRLARLAERTLTDVRGLIEGLAAKTPDGGLARALAAYIDDVRTPHGPALVFRAAGEPAGAPPGSGELFRIAQEAISNAERHANASKIEITLTSGSDGVVTLVVDDDGAGIGTMRQGGMGLQLMRERATSIGAVCTISDRDGGGTRVQVTTAPTLMRIA